MSAFYRYALFLGLTFMPRLLPAATLDKNSAPRSIWPGPMIGSILLPQLPTLRTYRFPKPVYPLVTGGAAGTTINNRCSTDQLVSNEAALARINWAESCGLVKKTRVFTEEYQEETDTWIPRGHFIYPIFARNLPQNAYPVWLPNLSSCEIPADVVWLSYCEMGCYQGDQKLSFVEGELPIGPIVRGEILASQLRTLDATATFEALTYSEQKIGAWTASVRDEAEVLLTIHTETGGQLTVTRGHPLVNQEGQMVEAHRLTSTDSLVKSDGSLDRIESIEEHLDFVGKVYNISPVSDNPLHNILSAQGYLNGSHKYQQNKFKEFQRILQRGQIPSDL